MHPIPIYNTIALDVAIALANVTTGDMHWAQNDCKYHVCNTREIRTMQRLQQVVKSKVLELQSALHSTVYRYLGIIRTWQLPIS